MKKRLLAILPHSLVVCALAALAITVVDGVNSQMGFLDSAFGRGILIAANVLAVALGALCALDKR